LYLQRDPLSYAEQEELIMRILLVTLALIALGLAAPVPARAQEMDECPHPPTIASLQTCVQHAADAGHIDNRGVARSLIAKLDAALAAFDREQGAVTVNTLEAFIHELDAQTGKHIGAEHASHLRQHAQDVIGALGG
jgi:hypothetical protein